VALWPELHFAYRLPELHIALETAEAIIASVAAHLVAGRFARRGRLDDLLLAYALGVFALTNLAFGAAPAALVAGPARFATWAAIAGRVVGTIALCAAAFVPARQVRLRSLPAAVLLCAAALPVAAVIAISLVEPSLPSGVDAELVSEPSSRPRLVGHPAVLGVQLILVVLFAGAAVGFARRAEREGDELLAWLAVASVLGAFARVNFFLYPSLYTEWVFWGDAFRLLFYATILIAAAREVRLYWRTAAEAAVLEERRRMARDLHDGLAQELAFMARNLQRLDRGSPVVRRLEAGAARALTESRRAIAALSEPLDRPLDAVLADAARDVAGREGTNVALALAPDVTVTAAQREGLVRIVSEAITNAARHGGAQLVRVELEQGSEIRLRIVDAGNGFDPRSPGRAGFGLISMRERAEALGGRLQLKSAPGRGTEVEVVL
jgi:signal transduction histidine kinase